MVVEELWLILPETVRNALRKTPLAQVYEIRLRVNAPVVVSIDGQNFPLPDALVSQEDLENLIHKAAEYAIYAVLDQMVKGFITIRGGVRIGIAGELVTQNQQVTAIKHISSICIRLPHAVERCSYAVLPYIFGITRPYNTLIVAPPGAGKTTLLRDIAREISHKYPRLNTLILDERGELAACYQGENQLDVGKNCDVITGGTKAFGFENGLRSLRPDVIITDEIATQSDAEMIRNAVRSGVVVLASAHAANLNEVSHKPGLGELLHDGSFDRYVVLCTGEHAGEVVGVYDGRLQRLWIGGWVVSG